MITMINFMIPFKSILFNQSRINYAYLYVLFLFESVEPQEDTVVYVFKEIWYVLCLTKIGTDVL